ncbi:hypothetical protein VTO58DRAFT_105258 [Aureobasidium pullulans]|uniref:Uncharacterized protein n=1 Tax=Aureobasidium pullulans TaxID=5580 RepID=A0A4S9H390_AURPU|nr:hypothetical protein JADG_010552 [Aureobasidium pullulans]THV78006.1 hypothetical protein D6D29_08026 [Aureobasidium pullulans]THW08406.1 hypothetical protein D6D24_09236 [Aureobasidium pullulans]THX58460.1 hypothetical protein D6D06_02934 [Aureobasidium pullulans]THX68544.1 hypothetical protein D6D05_09379 [Aureobasidium pullulans]
MYSRSLLLPLAWSVSYLSGVNADCESYGIDFVNNGNYFINSQSNQSFTSVTEFAGCAVDVAAVELVNWDTGDEYLCSDIPLQPDDTPETSTCDIEKDQMKSGTWGLILISNNGVDPDSPPFANQRTFYLTVGAQATSTVTPTLTFNMTTTPTITSQTTSFIVNTTTVNNSMTVTVPAATRYVTITPLPTYTTKTISLTRTLKTWTRTAIIYTATATASCTVPPRPQQPDPPCRRWPRLIKVPAGVSINGKRDEELETYASVKKRLADIRARRAADIDARDLAKRTADAPTVTITQTTLTVNQTNTFTAAPTTVINIVLSSSIVTTTLPPATIKTGYAKAYITLPPITKTKFTVNTAYIWQTKTMTAKFTKVTTVTPTGIMTACKSRGGHFGNGW